MLKIEESYLSYLYQKLSLKEVAVMIYLLSCDQLTEQNNTAETIASAINVNRQMVSKYLQSLITQGFVEGGRYRSTQGYWLSNYRAIRRQGSELL